MTLYIHADECGYRINTTPPQPGSRESVCPENPHPESNRLDEQTPQHRSAIVHRLIVSFTRAA